MVGLLSGLLLTICSLLFPVSVLRLDLGSNCLGFWSLHTFNFHALLSIKFILLINVKMPTIVNSLSFILAILTFMSSQISC